MSGVTADIESPVSNFLGREEDIPLYELPYEIAAQEAFKNQPKHTEDEVYNADQTVFPPLN